MSNIVIITIMIPIKLAVELYHGVAIETESVIFNNINANPPTISIRKTLNPTVLTSFLISLIISPPFAVYICILLKL